MIKNINTFSDDRGCLTVAEIMKDIPFEVKRIYWIYNVPEKKKRGFHANRITYQYLVAVKGNIKVGLENKEGKSVYLLDAPNKGLLIPPMTWNELEYLSEDAVLLVLSSEQYCPEMYINSYEEFLKEIEKCEK